MRTLGDERPTSDAAVELPVVVELHPILAGRADEPGESEFPEAVRDAVAHEVSALLSALGIPGRPAVRVEPRAEAAGRAHRLLRLTVGDRVARFPEDVVRATYRARQRAAEAPTWVEILMQLRAAETPSVAAFLADVCREAIVRRPQVLLARAQLEAYRDGAPTLAELRWGRDIDVLERILMRVLSLGISLGDRAGVARVLGSESVERWEDVAEDLVSALREPAIVVQMAPEYLRELTERFTDAGGPDSISDTRQELFTELGVPLPAFRFEPAPRFAAGSFAFRINALSTQPIVGVPADHVFVNEQADVLRSRDIDAEPMPYPMSDSQGSIVHATSRERVESTGARWWSPVAYLAGCLTQTVRSDVGRVLEQGTVARQLRDLATWNVIPALSDVDAPEMAPRALTPVLRALVDERVSVRNLPLIYGRLLERAAGVETDGELPGRLAFVRAQLASQIANRSASGAAYVAAYLMSEDFETALSAPRTVDGDDALLDAIHAEFDRLGTVTTKPALLTEGAHREALAALVASELPQVSVLSYEEIPPAMNVQPIGRITIDA
ncbi:type III secretion FHIPEP protein [Gemmatirosa kalamazoonensis]|uniref:Type III secretion FHIPEP protein n=1 Tax=Gemmatirosa kalamazoonensis TaxID=861299 RepID=W0RMY6_9BACT|nr:FHIPEP family type III secretion protein [Gemmatirosa kalamazoonensis]AHG91675.1 type III secretion FHIPEP protein [Gemmatirosa kalamazoonensis]